eukprot:s12780_g1.t1
MLGHFGSQGDGLLWGPLRLLPGGGTAFPLSATWLGYVDSWSYCFSTVGDLAGLRGQLVVDGSLAFRSVHFTEIYTNGLHVPQPAVAGALVKKVQEVPTTVLFVRFQKQFMTKAKWEEALKSPQATFHLWVDGSLAFRSVHFTEIYTNGLHVPQLAVAGALVKKVPEVPTTVLFVRFQKQFMTKAKWEEALKSPQATFHLWVSSHGLRVRDSFAWAKERQQNDVTSVFGVARIDESDAEALAALSGHEGLFLDPSRRSAFPAFATEWIDRLPKEPPLEYLARLSGHEGLSLRLSTWLGPVLSARSMGWLVALGR